jgi:hypothetical protein
MVIYALYAASFLLVITAIVAIVINYVKKGDVAGNVPGKSLSLADSHLLVWAAVGGVGRHCVPGGRGLVRARGERCLDYLPYRQGLAASE